MTEDMEVARTLARQLDVYNRRRQDIEREILGEILREIENTADPQNSRSLVFASSRWHPGVIGIVASRLVDRYYRPPFLSASRMVSARDRAEVSPTSTSTTAFSAAIHFFFPTAATDSPRASPSGKSISLIFGSSSKR